MERMRDLEDRCKEQETTCAKTVKFAEAQAKTRNEKELAVREDIESVKKDLAERKRDISQLIEMMAELGIGQFAQNGPLPLVKHLSEPTLLKPLSNDKSMKT
jgi:hypothetical protein